MLSPLMNHLWQSTLFAAAVALVVLLLRSNGAHTRYWLWWVASIKFLVPFSLLAAVGERLAGGAPPVQVFSDWSAALAEPVPASPVSPALGIMLLTIWAAGFLFVAGRWIVRARRIAALLRAAAPGPESLLPAGMRGPAVKLSDAFVEPGIVGVRRPVLLLPRGLDAQLSPGQLRAVVAHELCHWRRRDNLTAAVHMVVEAVFWFHPLVWWMGARLIDERERACDEAVVRDGHDRHTYAEAILNVCERYVASPLPCASGVSGADLKRRVAAIIRHRGTNDLSAAKKWLLSIGAFCTLALPVAVGMAQDDADVLPLVRIAPEYPVDALESGLEGWVQLEFTITEEGTTADVVVVESSSPLFEQPAIDAMLKWRYAPPTENGQPVEARGIHTIIRFVLDKAVLRQAPSPDDGTGGAPANA